MKDNKGNIILCDYGCGKEAMYIMKNGKYCCQSHYNKCPTIRIKNSKGLKKAYEEGKINQKEIYQNMNEESKRKMNWSKGKCLLNTEDIENSKFVSNETIRKLIQSGKITSLKYKCKLCGNNGLWLQQPLILELHHINGNHHDNHISNLIFLCPNCHSQTNNFRARNKRCSGKYKIMRKELLEHLNSDFNGNIENFIEYYRFNNTSKVYREYFKLLKQGLLTL